jgi:hypothetical protein
MTHLSIAFETVAKARLVAWMKLGRRDSSINGCIQTASEFEHLMVQTGYHQQRSKGV